MESGRGGRERSREGGREGRRRREGEGGGEDIEGLGGEGDRQGKGEGGGKDCSNVFVLFCSPRLTSVSLLTTPLRTPTPPLVQCSNSTSRPPIWNLWLSP